MDANDIEKLVKKAKDDILKEVNDRLPRKVGVIAARQWPAPLETDTPPGQQQP